MFQEISPENICEYKNPIALFDEGAVTMVAKGDTANPMTIAWGAIGVLWRKPTMTVYIHKTRYSKELFDAADRFAVCFFGPGHEDDLSYFGSASGRDEDKNAARSLTLVQEDGYFYYEEAELVVFCKKVGQTDFDLDHVEPAPIKAWYQKGGVHSIYCGEIAKVLRRE